MNHVLCFEIYWTYSCYLKSLLSFSTYVSYGLKVFWFPFYRIFASKYEKCLQLSNTAFHACFNAFHPHPISYFLLGSHTNKHTIYIYSHTHQLINSYTLMQTQPHTQSLFFFLHYFSVCILFLSWKHIQKVTLTLVLSRFKLLPLFLSINIRHFSTFYRLSSLNVLFRFLLLISRYTFSFKKNCFYFHSNE